MLSRLFGVVIYYVRVLWGVGEGAKGVRWFPWQGVKSILGSLGDLGK